MVGGGRGASTGTVADGCAMGTQLAPSHPLPSGQVTEATHASPRRVAPSGHSIGPAQPRPSQRALPGQRTSARHARPSQRAPAGHCTSVATQASSRRSDPAGQATGSAGNGAEGGAEAHAERKSAANPRVPVLIDRIAST
jgi:hypothetical protein